MKRHGNLWEQMISFEALLCAAEQARKGKRFRPEVASFHFDQERALWKLHEELSTKTYRPGAYRSFFIYEPKQRQISAAPYRDRVVHHALVNVLEPIYEKTFIADSYACRRGKGTHAAVVRCQQFARRFRYVLKADIQKFFPSVDHEVLKALVARKIKDRDVLWLVNQIIDGSNPQEEVQNHFPGDDLFTPGERRRGIPIGNQTSQFFANVYLDPLDHFVKARLEIRGYVRYVDDFLVFSDDKMYLADVREKIRAFLVPLRLRLHPKKNVISPVTCRAHPSRSGPPQEHRGEEDVRWDRLLAKRQHARRRLEGIAHRQARPRRRRRGIAGAARQGIRHHGQADEELDTGRAGRRRGRR